MVWPPPDPTSGVELVRSYTSVPSAPNVRSVPTWPVNVRTTPGSDAVSVITRLVSVHRPTRHASPIASGVAVGAGVAVRGGGGGIVWVAVGVGLHGSLPSGGALGPPPAGCPPHEGGARAGPAAKAPA